MTEVKKEAVKRIRISQSRHRLIQGLKASCNKLRLQYSDLTDEEKAFAGYDEFTYLEDVVDQLLGYGEYSVSNGGEGQRFLVVPDEPEKRRR